MSDSRREESDHARLIPITLRQANEFIARHHRHHSTVRGCKFCIGLEQDGALVAVVVAARPVARQLDDGKTIEITRLCAIGVPNSCSRLYQAAWRAAREMGYQRAITYILISETGVSLKAAGWKLVAAATGGGTWSRKGRNRVDHHPLEKKQRWMISI